VKIIWGGWFLGLIYTQISPDGVSDSVFKLRQARARDAQGLLPKSPQSPMEFFLKSSTLKEIYKGHVGIPIWTPTRSDNEWIDHSKTGDNRLLELDRER